MSTKKCIRSSSRVSISRHSPEEKKILAEFVKFTSVVKGWLRNHKDIRNFSRQQTEDVIKCASFYEQELQRYNEKLKGPTDVYRLIKLCVAIKKEARKADAENSRFLKKTVIDLGNKSSSSHSFDMNKLTDTDFVTLPSTSGRDSPFQILDIGDDIIPQVTCDYFSEHDEPNCIENISGHVDPTLEKSPVPDTIFGEKGTILIGLGDSHINNYVDMQNGLGEITRQRGSMIYPMQESEDLYENTEELRDNLSITNKFQAIWDRCKDSALTLGQQDLDVLMDGLKLAENLMSQNVLPDIQQKWEEKMKNYRPPRNEVLEKINPLQTVPINSYANFSDNITRPKPPKRPLSNVNKSVDIQFSKVNTEDTDETYVPTKKLIRWERLLFDTDTEKENN